MKTVVFQGDSITDCGRNLTNGSEAEIGQGFALIVSAKLGYKYPGKYQFINKGVCGECVSQVYSRFEEECWAYNPDILSLLVGINDVYAPENENGINIKKFKEEYKLLLNETLTRFPAVKILLLEPFALLGSRTEDKWSLVREGADKTAAVVKELAEEFKQIFIPLQEKFNEAEKRFKQPYWIADGVHPTPAGHQLIADAWLKAYYENIV